MRNTTVKRTTGSTQETDADDVVIQEGTASADAFQAWVDSHYNPQEG